MDVGDPSLKYDDNGWIFCATAQALGKAALMAADPALPAGKVKIMFWGDGAPIQKHFEDHYQLQEQEAALQTYNFISKDKKLTHDLFDATGYAHIIPRQELLEPPSDLEKWFQPQLERLAKTLCRDVPRDSHEEHVRHWWANESPSFVAERCCSSMPTTREGALYDGTMRVTFALRRRLGASETLTPEDIEVDWLGGYWKLPNADMTSSLIRERIISQAKTGTAPVQPYILMEVYGALSSALQQLFGAAEFTSERLKEQYRSQPEELAAYLIARRAISLEPEQRLQALRLGDPVSPARACVQSFLHRAHGVLIARGNGPERWKEAKLGAESAAGRREHFRRAVDAHPANSNALFQLGMCALELGPLDTAIELMNKSLLLDSDFRAPYVNLGVAFLRRASHTDDPVKAQEFYLRAVEISESCLTRHPASPQCNYHIGVACTQLAFYLQDREGVDCKDPKFVELRSRAQREFLEARPGATCRRVQ
ncbi:unnamed protein product [Durusdinium trenchii]|uniref:Tetratricopeptide repeat protein n=1 Tax=Durusdinium trenchii TaxID=1381693 RepID=A0ABP0RUQ1_9DINO